MAEAAFSEDGKYFSAISQDGRLRIWDTETNVLKQEYTPDLHLTSPPSCLQWLTATQTTGSSRKGQHRKSSISEQENQYIALGTTSGKILVYYVAQAKVETVLESKTYEVHKKSIKSLDWHRQYGLYSCNEENVVSEWDLNSASVRNKYDVNIESNNKQKCRVSAIKIVPHNKNTKASFLMTASWQLLMWRLHNGDAEVVKSFGYKVAAKSMLTLTSLKNTCWLVQGSQNERLLSFWDVTVSDDHIPQVNGEDTTPNKKKRKKSISSAPLPMYNFVLEDAPKLLDIKAWEEDGGMRLSLAATARSGVVHYYGHMLNGSTTKPIKPTVTIQVTTADAEPLPLQCCRIPSNNDLILGYLSGQAVMFERMTPDLKSKTQVLFRGETKQAKKSKRSSEVTKTRGEVARDDVTYVEPMGGVARKRTTPGGTVDVPIERRLANLTVDVASRSKSAINTNLTKLLMQGLNSQDKGLIQSVLQSRSAASASVTSLPAACVPRLLDQLTDMAAMKTSQCVSACVWSNAVCRTHAAALLAAPAAAPKLQRLLAVLTHRRSHLCQLLNLKGRLELTMSQREARDKQQTEQQPMLEYNDTSEEEEDMELERSPSASEQSWREDSGDVTADTDSDGDGD